jgi:WD40 repeat protein/DNA-binding SARP family transcriptional activator/ABC-type cobalamin/Fe3+-siderophores transport system ATPase subunit
MRFRVLGPLEVEADDGPVRLGGPKERLLLALLLTRPNQVVSVEALIAGLWGEQPPPTAARTLQSHVKRLRRVLEPDRVRGAAGQVLVTRQPGYLLLVALGALDAARFEELTGQAHHALDSGVAGTAASLLRQALELWRGQAFEEFQDSDLTVVEADRLAELRLTALEDRIEADLRLGRHRALVAELEGLVREHPLRERLWAQLLLALYRAGRQADALLAYQRARSILVEELGIDPGAELRRLQAAVLAQDPVLDLSLAAEAAAARELPEALQPVGPPFVGRAAELGWLGAAWTQAAHGRGGVVFLAGAQGMGKTRLAAELAREVHEQGGSVLYGRCTADPHDPLQPFTQALVGWGAAGGDMPGVWQSPTAFSVDMAGLLAGRPDAAVLLVLDDLHLAKPPALEALAGLAAGTASRRLLVLGVYQDEAAAPTLAELVQRLDPGGATHRRLGPLNQDEVARVLALYRSEQAARAAASAVLERTGGVPLLVHQAAGDWAQAQAAQQLEHRAGQIASDRSHLREDSARFTDAVADLRGLHEHTQQVARLATGQGPPDAELEDRPAAAVCPYKGLARFEPSDAEFFFGRERLVAELVTHLVGAGLVGVVGPSGSGKSSLVRAGLLPALREGVLPGSDRWRQLLLRPGDHPMAELAGAAGRRDAARDGNDNATDGDGGKARQAPTPRPAAGQWVWRALAGAERLLLVVDQFEEVFTTCRDEGERTAFLAALTEAAWADSHVTVVVTIRADFYGHLAAVPDLADLLAANHVLVGPMRQDELRRAIELPAHRAGLRLEPGLSAAMVDEVADQPGGLPLLSCALLESWQHRHGRTLTLAAYHQAGGVRGAVARLAEHAWSGLDTDQQQTARRILLRLAGPGEGEAVVRRRAPMSELAASNDEHVWVVVEALTDQRLLTKSQDTVEVAHEALLREWPRLRGWLEEDVQGRALHRHLIGAAREWEMGGRDPGELYRGARLTAALDWAREHHADLNELERAFLDASQAAAEREVADARRRAEREARTSRRLRGLLAGLAGVLVLALVAGGFALALRGRAERQALVAQRQTVVAESRRLGAQALLEGDLDRSLLLAVEAVHLDDSVDSRSALLTSLLRSPQARRVVRGDGNQLQNVTLSPDGRTLVAVDNAGNTDLWDTRTGRRLHSPSGWALAFSRDGRLLTTGTFTTGGYMAELWLWDLAPRRIVKVLTMPGEHQDIVEAAFSSDGRFLAAGTSRGFLIVWDVTSGTRLGPVLRYAHEPGLSGSLAFAREGTTLYTSVQGGKTMVWDVTRRRRVRTFPLSGRLAVSRDGKSLAVGQQDGSIILADAATGRRRRVLTAHSAAVTRLAFSRDGGSLASVSDDRTAILWDVATGKTRETLEGHAGSVTGVAFSPDGTTLYTSSLDDSVIAWDLTRTRGLVRRLTGAASPIVGVAFSPRDPNLLALAQRQGPVTLWDLAKHVRVGNSLDVTGGSANAVAFSPDGRTLAAADADGTVVLFDVATHVRVGRPLRPPYGPITAEFQSRDINSIAFSRDGRLLATAGNEGSVVVWDLSRRVPIGHPLHPGGYSVTGVAFSPDGRTLASGVDSGAVVLTRVPDGTLLYELGGLGISALAFSHDGKALAAATFDGSVRLWDPRTSAARGPAWAAAGGPVLSVSFSRDGSVLATSGSNGTAALWDVGSGKQIGVPLTGPSSPGVATFDPTGHTLATAFEDGTVLLWDVDPASWLKRACAVAARRLTQQEWQEFLPGRPYQPSCGSP